MKSKIIWKFRQLQIQREFIDENGGGSRDCGTTIPT